MNALIKVWKDEKEWKDERKDNWMTKWKDNIKELMN